MISSRRAQLLLVGGLIFVRFFFFSSRRRHTRFDCDWSSDVCSSDLVEGLEHLAGVRPPVIFLANHASHMDTPLILCSLPKRWRERTAVAAEIGRASCRGRV